MPFPLLAAIGMGVSAAGSMAGGAQGQAATQESAEAQLAIGRMNRQFQNEMFQEQLAQQQPYINLGAQAAPVLGQLINQRDFNLGDLPANRFQNETLQTLMGNRFGNVSQGIIGQVQNRMNVGQREATKNRLFDLLKIGSGSSATAGQSGSVTANALSNALMQSGAIRGSAAQSLYGSGQSMMNQAVQGISGLPAYMAYQNYQNRPALSQPVSTANTNYVSYTDQRSPFAYAGSGQYAGL